MALFSIGGLVGGLLLITILALALEWAIFKRLFDDPVKGKLSSVFAAWLLAGLIAGFGMAEGGQFETMAFLVYLLPAIIIGIWFYKKGDDLRETIAIQKAEESAAPFE